MNLWNKKVYDILFRLCGCKCGHGFLKHEEEIILPPPKQLQLKKTSTKAQLKPELKDVKLKKAKKLSSKSALSESFKRHQELKKEMGAEKENSEQAEEATNVIAEVYIPGLVTKTKTRNKKARKSSLESDCSTPPPVILNPGVEPFVPRFKIFLPFLVAFKSFCQSSGAAVWSCLTPTLNFSTAAVKKKKAKKRRRRELVGSRLPSLTTRQSSLPGARRL